MTEEFRAAIGSSDTVAVIGVGNVALDCARILIKGEEYRFSFEDQTLR